MKYFFVILCLGSALAVEKPSPFYHVEGIKMAAKIRAIESLQDSSADYRSLPILRVVGGFPSSPTEHPYLGGLVITLTSGQNSVCGSALVSRTKLITAAHCWFDGRYQASQFQVVLGSARLFTGGTRIKTTSVLTHHAYNPYTVANDIAIITISPVTLTASIQPLWLPGISQVNNNFVGSTGTVVGYGKSSDWSGISYSQSTRDVQVSVITNAACAQVYGTGTITTAHMCTSGAGGVGPCGGDSGGPLVYTIGGQDILIGVVSFGSIMGCASGRPAAYARITAFLPWLQQNI